MYKGLYHGGRHLPELARKLLKPVCGEADSVFQDRLNQASIAFDPHVATCCDQARNQLFIAGLSIKPLDSKELAPFYADFQQSCSAQGNTLDAFMADRFNSALIYGRSYWLIHFPDLEAQPVNQVEWEQDSNRAWLEKLDIDDVTNWSTDSNGDLKWLVIHSCQTVSKDPFSDQERQETFRVYDRQSVYTYQITYPADKPPQDKQEVPLISTKKHGLSQVPLVCLDLESLALALMPRAYTKQIQHWSLSACLSLATHKTCVPITLIKTDLSIDELRDGNLGSSKKVGQDDDVQLLTPDASSFQFQLEQLEAIKESIYSLCHFSTANTKEPRERPRSGAAKEIDAILTETALKTYGVVIKEAVQRTFNLIAIGRNDEPRFDISGLDSFSVSIRKMNVETAAALLDLPLPDSFKAQIKRLLRQGYLGALPKSLGDAIDKDCETLSKAPSELTLDRTPPSSVLLKESE